MEIRRPFAFRRQERSLPGKVTRNAASLDTSTRTMQVEIDVPNRDGKLTPGMYADVSLDIRRAGNALAVPVQAVDQSGSKPFVLVVNKSNRVEKRIVKIGVSTANLVGILIGLSDGDQVIAANLGTLSAGRTSEAAPQRNGQCERRRGRGPVMTGFALRYPFFIIMLCLVISVVGFTAVARMPVDLFPQIDIPVVVVATFYNGMPPEQIETDITGRFERFFTLGSGIDHIESRSLPGVSLIKIYFQPGTNPDSAVSTISNLAMADLRRLPPGTLPPVVLKFDASSLPVCLITLKGQGLSETRLRDLGQYNVRNQVANIPGASVPPPFGGKYRQIQVYVDPVKLQAHQLSVMDVVRTVNESNLILPAGDVQIGPKDFNIYTNSQLPDIASDQSICR